VSKKRPFIHIHIVSYAKTLYCGGDPLGYLIHAKMKIL